MLVELVCGLFYVDMCSVWVSIDGELVKLIFLEYWFLFYLIYYKGCVIFCSELVEYLYD